MGYSTGKIAVPSNSCLQVFQKKEYFPLTNFQKIPNLSNARWSTRAILVNCNPRIHCDPIYKTDVGENMQLYML